jgi:probable rRNA maturation factor
MIEISIDEPFEDSVDGDAMRTLLERALAAEGLAVADLSLLVTGDETVRELNVRYRGVDETTDVLSFGMDETAGPAFQLPPGLPRQLGEIVISHEQAERQAGEFGNGLPRELALLAVHGLLHLLGYDHETAEDRERMLARERAILETPTLIERGGA